MQISGIIFLGFLTFIIACNDTEIEPNICEPTPGLTGEWNWLQSAGGIGGWTLAHNQTPLPKT